MDFDFIRRFAPMYVRAAGLTLRIGLIGILLSLAVGAALYRRWMVTFPKDGYPNFSRCPER